MLSGFAALGQRDGEHQRNRIGDAPFMPKTARCEKSALAGRRHHRHLGDKEEPYRFSSVETLMADFLADVQRVRGES